MGEPIQNRLIGITYEREGDFIGLHRVTIEGAHERVELKHEVRDRRVFAEGAVKAAAYIVQKECGLYGMRDMLE
jgi:4-hydroxy-tetrahydrodipicolinate reductase